MLYGSILKDAIKTGWKNKLLMVFGVLVSNLTLRRIVLLFIHQNTQNYSFLTFDLNFIELRAERILWTYNIQSSRELEIAFLAFIRSLS